MEKVEIDSAPVLGFDVETLYLKEPLPVSLKVLKESSLFAGKVSAALYRAWQRRIKGRDWYDLIWFLRRGVPLNSRYLVEYMRFTNNFKNEEELTEKNS